MSVQQTVAKNSIYNIIGSFAPVLVIIITVPLYIDLIGEARYGILALVWLILGYFGLFDLGLGKAVANQIAYFRNSKKENRNEEGEIFWSAFQVNLLLGLIGGVVLFVVGPWIVTQIADNQDQLLNETIESFKVLALAVPIVTLASMGNGFLEGKEKFGIINLLQVMQNIIFQIFPLLTAYYIDVSLYYLITAAVISKLLSTVTLFLIIKLNSRVGLITFSTEKVKELTSYGGAITVSNIIGPILTSIDRFLIGAVAGAKAVTYYTIPYDLSLKLSRITASYSRALFPQFSMLSENESRNLADSAITILITFITPAIVTGFLLLDPFLTVWIGEDLASNSIVVGYIILMGVWINNLAYIPITFLRGQKQPGTVAFIHSIELIPYLVILWTFTKTWGVEGAAFAWTLRVAVDAVLLFIYAGFYQRLCYSIPVTSIIILGSFLLTFYNVLHHQYILTTVILIYIIYGSYRYKSECVKLLLVLKSYLRK